MINNPTIAPTGAPAGGGKLTGEQRHLELNAMGQVTDVLDTPAKMICGAMSFHKDGQGILYTKDMFCLRPGESKVFDENNLRVTLFFRSNGRIVMLNDNYMFVSAAAALYFAIR